MRNPERIDRICNLLSQVWHRYPDFRFWQIIGFLKYPENIIGKDLFFVEDDVWEQIFENTLKNSTDDKKG